MSLLTRCVGSFIIGMFAAGAYTACYPGDDSSASSVRKHGESKTLVAYGSYRTDGETCVEYIVMSAYNAVTPRLTATGTPYINTKCLAKKDGSVER